jgi:hypothetical protein
MLLEGVWPELERAIKVGVGLVLALAALIAT